MPENSQELKSISTMLTNTSFKGQGNLGMIFVFGIIGLVTALSLAATGRSLPTNTQIKAEERETSAYACCDTGSGASCEPILENQIKFHGEDYALLKSGIYNYSAEHVAPTEARTPSGYRIFVNTSDSTSRHFTDQCPRGMDLIAKHDPALGGLFDPPYYGGCIAIPNEQLIYVCKASEQECSKNFAVNVTPFDAYYRIKDGPVSSDISTNCPVPKIFTTQPKQKIVGLSDAKGEKNLQLETFQVVEEGATTPWLSAWCKPAIYLYPERKTAVNVKVAPQGDFQLTIPKYPQSGWNVTAYPNGRIEYGSATYPYLYWEASIPDKLINKPKEGYVVTQGELESLFHTILPQLGLNATEREQFSEYWLKALPESPYYFVGVMPEKELDALAPLKILPQPDSVLRVTLYFQAIEEKISVKTPELSGFTRKGFTVTEWGGFFKADKAHKDFTCLM